MIEECRRDRKEVVWVVDASSINARAFDFPPRSDILPFALYELLSCGREEKAISFVGMAKAKRHERRKSRKTTKKVVDVTPLALS